MPLYSRLILANLLPVVVLGQGVVKFPPPEAKIDAEQDIPVFRSDTRRVVLYTSVLDRSGKMDCAAPDLVQNSRKWLRAADPLFRRDDISVSMGLIIDNSGSMRDKRARSMPLRSH